jgi:hypothetical protein
MSITFSTCWYVFKAKFDVSVYEKWIHNMLSNVHQYNLVIYSDESSSQILEKYLGNPKIKLIIKPYDQFYNYKYKDMWINNHDKNHLLRERVDWKVNMLWAEKIHFVKETIDCSHFDTDFYGWCDIGYFRGEHTDLDYNTLSNWPNPQKVFQLNPNKIYYACVNNSKEYINQLFSLINNSNSIGLPRTPIPPNQVSIAGGFFLCHKDKISWWKQTFDAKLCLYFENNYLVKDDQIIIINCIFSNLSHFVLLKEEKPQYNNWFLFQRYLI